MEKMINLHLFYLWFFFNVFLMQLYRKQVKEYFRFYYLFFFLLVLIIRKSQRDSTPSVMYAFSSFTYLFAMLSSNYALEFVSYPMQVKFIKIFFYN
jgi:hypothetical protein